ncbi:N-acetyltransferase [Nocardiopsis gilva YIM 90087]|uniref:N-acetyltransferase n=1 Tax=Nocardiopsis gilva YIM 90087 TaxID=1235441 RepID=A0A223S1N7_9ACTN|nr:GNAT family N-acetyltransferase [Nocardiopsis gilva]ASU82053.1 N-acetyltransferase [Nocardiopsis gilva YIM 90087]
MSDRSPAGEQLRTARLSLRRPTEADIDAISAIHRDPETRLHNPSDALARLDEAGALYRCWHDQWQRCGHGYWVVRRPGSARQLGSGGIVRAGPTRAEHRDGTGYDGPNWIYAVGLPN